MPPPLHPTSMGNTPAREEPHSAMKRPTSCAKLDLKKTSWQENQQPPPHQTQTVNPRLSNRGGCIQTRRSDHFEKPGCDGEEDRESTEGGGLVWRSLDACCGEMAELGSMPNACILD